jgi:Zn-dependent protease with chaperone function
MTAAAEPDPPPRLNPFAFPSDTTFRFLLLVVSIVGVSLFLFNWLYFSVADNRADLQAQLACLREQQAAYAAATSLDDIGAANDRYNGCLAAVNRPKAAFMLGGVGALLALATALLFLRPAWKLRRRRLVPLTEEDSPEVAAELDGLVREAGLERPPRFVWNPLDAGGGGLAFGRPGRSYVALSGGLVTLFAVDRPAFRAVVLHELAHLRNRDVTRAYFSVSVWHAFLLVAVAPFAVSLADEDAGTVLRLGWRLAAMTLLVYLTRNAVLRAREVYADVRASTSPRVGAALRRILAARPAGARARPRILRLHPTAEERIRALESTDGLFGLGTLEAFGAGIAATIAYAEVTTLVGFYSIDPFATMWLSAAVFAPLATCVVGLGAWRGAFGALARGRRPGGSVRLGLALGAGLLVGERVSLSRGLGEDVPIVGAELWGIEAAWAAVILVGLCLFVAWIAASAAVWLPATARSRSPAWAYGSGLVVASFVLTVALGIFFIVRTTREAVRIAADDAAALHDAAAAVMWAGPSALWQLVMNFEVLTFLARPIVWPAAVALWAYPLAAAFLSRGGGVAPWGSLEPPGVTLRPARLRVRQAALFGAIGAALAFLLPLVLRAVVHARVPTATRDQDPFALGFSFWLVVLALVLQGLVAAVVALRTEQAAVVHALFAAMLTGAGATLAIVTQPSLASCVEPISVRPSTCEWLLEGDVLRFTFEQVAGEGVLAALAGAGLAVGIRAAVRRLRAAGAREAPSSPATT